MVDTADELEVIIDAEVTGAPHPHPHPPDFVVAKDKVIKGHKAIRNVPSDM